MLDLVPIKHRKLSFINNIRSSANKAMYKLPATHTQSSANKAL